MNRTFNIKIHTTLHLKTKPKNSLIGESLFKVIWLCPLSAMGGAVVGEL